jgi:hypothetical protein
MFLTFPAFVAIAEALGGVLAQQLRPSSLVPQGNAFLELLYPS